MATLVLNAPRGQAQANGKKSFDSTLRTGVGEGYAIAHNIALRCSPGCRVVLLCQDDRKRAEGRLVRLVATEKTLSGMQRYDVHMEGLTVVSYTPERLNRCGVGVIG